jgi:hypothetical protein
LAGSDDNNTRLSLISSKGPLEICHPEGRHAAQRISTDRTGQPLQSWAEPATFSVIAAVEPYFSTTVILGFVFVDFSSTNTNLEEEMTISIPFDPTVPVPFVLVIA